MKSSLLKDVRPEEKTRVFIMLIHSFFQGIIFSLYFTAANSLFVSLPGFKIEWFPIAFLCMGGMGFVLGQAIMFLRKRFSFLLNQYLNLFILMGAVSTLYFLLKAFPEDRFLVIFGFFVWVRPLMYVIDLQFWGLASFLFDYRQSKRLFGLISTGYVVSSILGMFSIPLLLKWIEPEGLFLFVIAGLILWSIFHVFSMPLLKDHFKQDRPRSKKPPKTSVLSLAREKYVKYLFAVACLSGICLILVDYNFLIASRAQLPDKASFAGFFSIFFGIMGVLQLLFRTFLTGQLINRFGTGLGVMGLPIVILAFATVQLVFSFPFTASFVMTLFLMITCMKMFDQVLRIGIQDPSLQLLSQPFPTPTRLKIQTIVAGIIFPIALASTGVLLYLVLLIGYPPLIPILLMLLAITWIWQGRNFSREYGPRLHKLLDSMKKTSKEGGKDKSPNQDRVKDLLFRLDNPLKEVRSEALVQLNQLPLSPEQRPIQAHERMMQEIELAASSLFARYDLFEEDETHALVKHLQDDYQLSVGNIYEWLALVFDPEQIQLIRQTFEGDSDEFRAFSAELLEVVAGSKVKDLLFPILHEMPLGEKVMALSEVFVYIPASGETRLKDIVHAPSYAFLPTTRIAALEALVKQYPHAERDVRALKGHPLKLISESASRFGKNSN